MVTTNLVEYTLSPDAQLDDFSIDAQSLFGSQQWSGLAWYRIAPTWVEARPINRLDDLDPKLGMHLLMLRNGNEIICAYPVSSDTAISTIRGSASDLSLHVAGVSPRVDGGRAALVTGRANGLELYALVPDVISKARAWLLGCQEADLEPFRPFPAEGPLEKVGFCTWSSLGEDIRPTADNLKELIDKLVKNDIPVQSFILDDGWHSRKTYARGPSAPFRSTTGPEEERDNWQLRGLWAFEAHEGLGPDGLRGVVQAVHEAFGKQERLKGTVETGVWLALTGGYWDGIHPDSPLVKKYNCRAYPVSRARFSSVANDPFTVAFLPERPGNVYHLPPPSEAYRFWKDWFDYLYAQGVTFLKVDNQGSASVLDGSDGAECMLALWRTMTTAADEVFGHGRVIHCMSHHEQMWGGVQGLGVETGGERFVWRNSDDFGLGHKKVDAHQQHIFTNLTNAILTSSLCMVLDADMFMTAAQDPDAHALLRAMYPGPLLLSDRPGEHDQRILARLSARNSHGILETVQSATPALPLARRALDPAVLGTGDGPAMLASVRVHRSAIIGAWNVRDDVSAARAQVTLTMSDLEDALPGISGRYILLSRNDVRNFDQTSKLEVLDLPLQVTEAEVAKIDLAGMEAAMFILTPLIHVDGGVEVAVLGLLDKYAGICAVGQTTQSPGKLQMTLSQEGQLALAFPKRPSKYELSVGSVVVAATWEVVNDVHLLVAEIRGSSHVGNGDGSWDITLSVDA